MSDETMIGNNGVTNSIDDGVKADDVNCVDCVKADEELLNLLHLDGELSDEQKKAVLANGHILVSAAAGSGKTSTMVKRIIFMIAKGTSLRNMLVLVYNTAAADELKEKLYAALFKQACSARGELRERFRKELDDLPFCHICTIHSFCNSLIRDNFASLGVSPSFEVLDEAAHAAYMRTALDKVFEEYATENDEVFDDVAEIFSQARREDNLRTNIVKLYTLIDVQPDKEKFYDKVKQCYSSFENSEFMRILSDYYKTYFADAERKLCESSKLLSTTSLEKYKIAVQISIALCKEIEAADSFRKICAIASEYEKPNLGRRVKIEEFEKKISDVAKAYLDDLFDVTAELAQLIGEFDKMCAAHAQNKVYIDKMIEITMRFDEELKKLKQADNVLSFEDLQHYAMRLLDERPDIGDAYQAVFVDEYQDVNPTQEFIISRLLREESFMVGDVKQSIYGFRLADPTIFIRRGERYINGEGTAIYFNRNFRSARAILGFVNDVFDVVMTAERADVDYKKTSQFVLDGTPPNGFVQVHLFTDKKAERKVASGLYDITAHEQGDDGVSASRFEGRYIANEINALVGKAITLDRDGNGRVMRYDDIAILFRSRSKGAAQIVEELRAAGIPIDEGVFGRSVSRPERDLITILRVIDNPRQDIPLAGLLLSFFGGYDESELAKIAALDGECLYDKAIAFIAEYAQSVVGKDGSDTVYADGANEKTRELNVLGNKLKKTFALIDAYRLKTSFKSVSALMSGIVSDFCYDAYLMKSGEADVYGLKSFIASVAERDNKSLGRFLDDYSEVGDSRGASGGGDRVHISTFHGYKGLERPVVFVADTAYGFNYESGAGDMSTFGDGCIGLRFFDFQNKFKHDTLSKMAVSKLNKTERVKEEMRLFYVALTRAKQMMYITASVSAKKLGEFGALDKIGGASCDLDFISSAICEADIKVPVFRHEDELAESKQCVEHMVLPYDVKLTDAIEKMRKFIYPHMTATRLAMKYSVSSIDKADEPTVSVFDEGAAIGTLYHKIMQYIDFFAEGEDGVAKELERLVAENVLIEEECKSVDVSVIARCLDSEIIRLAGKAQLYGKCMREQPFMMYKPAREVSPELDTDDKVLVQGIVDLFINGEKKILVDFKYSRMDDERLVERYKTQLYLYKTAIESAVNTKIDRVVIYSFRTGSTLDISF